MEGYISKFQIKMLTSEVKLYTSCNNKANFSVEISEVFLLISTLWNKITPSSLLLKLLYNLPHQDNFSTSMGQNLSPTFSVPPWLYSAKSNRIRCFLYFSVSSGYKSRRLTRVLWCERWHNYRYVTRKSGDWGYRSPNVKLVKQAICHSQSAN